MAMVFMAANGAAFAAHINHDRTGQVALLPYYTVNNNFITNFTVTNTSLNYKAVRVRVVDSRLGADLLNINLYLSPTDVWNATLRMNPDTGLPNLVTEDESCTYPAKTELQAGLDFQNPYSETTDADLTEGYVEIIEMGDIADGPGPALDGGLEAEIDASGVADGIIDSNAGDRSITQYGLLHDWKGVPADCSVVADAWAAGMVSTSAINGFEPGSLSPEGIAQDGGDPDSPYDDSHNAGLVAPSGGINAFGILINTGTGAALVQEGIHIDRYTSVPQHYLPNDPAHYRLPSLASGDIREAYITNTLGDGRKGGILPLTEYDTGALQDIAPLPSVPMGSNPLPIALILSAESVSAPYFIERNNNGGTDAVLTFPMRKHGIYNAGRLTNQWDENATACAGELNDGIDDGGEVTLTSLGVVVQDYPHDGTGAYCKNAGFDAYQGSGSDVVTSVYYYDYEEGTSYMCFECEPSLAPVNTLFNQYLLGRSVNVNHIVRPDGYTTSLFGTPSANIFTLNLDVLFEAGWVTFSFTTDNYIYRSNPAIQALTEPQGGLGDGVINHWTGVPVIGFAAMTADIGPGQLGETVELIRSVDRE